VLLFGFLALGAARLRRNYLLDRFIRIMIFAIAAIGLDLLVGYGALISFACGLHGARRLRGRHPGVARHHEPPSRSGGARSSCLFAFLTGIVSLRTAASTSS